MKINTFNRAEHKEKGITSIDSSRKAGDRITRNPIIAGTLQPNPISDMTKERPSNKCLLNSASQATSTSLSTPSSKELIKKRAISARYCVERHRVQVQAFGRFHSFYTVYC